MLDFSEQLHFFVQQPHVECFFRCAVGLVHFLDEPHGQLFDLSSDPDEAINLWDDPAAAGEKERLLTELREWRIRSGVHTKDWCGDWR